MATILTQPHEQTSSPRQHLGYLDGMRALAALYIIFHHCLAQVNTLTLHSSKWLGRGLTVFSHGHSAVDVFIVLSGFCLALPVVRGNGYLSGGAITFFKKRARRILPPYFFAFALSLLLIYTVIGYQTGTHWDISLPVTWGAIITHLFLVQDIFSDTIAKINHAFWSISIEWRIYFMFPLLMLLRRRWGSLAMTVVCLAVSLVLVNVGDALHQFGALKNVDLFGSAPQYLGLFALGLLGADIAFGKSPPLISLRKPVFVGLFIVASTLMILLSRAPIWHGDIMPVAYADVFVGLWAATLMIAAANTEIGWLNRALSWRPLVAVGTFAYSIYLIHAPLIQVIWQYLLFPLQAHPLLRLMALFVLGTPLIVGVSYGFFLVCERPFLNTRKRETFAETERDAALSPAP